MSLIKIRGPTCCAVGCSMRRRTNLLSKVRMFSFPKDPLRRQLWELAVRRKNWNATANTRLCNFHFISGAPSAIKTHPDYVPTIFKHSRQSTDVGQKLSRYERSVKRNIVADESLISDDGKALRVNRLKPNAVPSLHLPVTDHSDKNTKKYQAATKKHTSTKVSRSVAHSPTSSRKTTLPSKKISNHKFDPTKASEKELRQSTIDMWQENEELKKDIECLQNQGYKEDQLKQYIDTLKEHHYIKDLAMRIMGMLADVQNTTLTKVQEELGMK